MHYDSLIIYTQGTLICVDIYARTRVWVGVWVACAGGAEEGREGRHREYLKLWSPQGRVEAYEGSGAQGQAEEVGQGVPEPVLREHGQPKDGRATEVACGRS